MPKKSEARSIVGYVTQPKLALWCKNYQQDALKKKKGKTHVYPFHQVRLVRLMRYGKNVP